MIYNYPWTYHYDHCDEYGNGEIHDSYGGFIAITTGPNYGAFHKDGSVYFERIARLIAAAPELLEALEGFIACWDTCADPREFAAKARDAISKATGE